LAEALVTKPYTGAQILAALSRLGDADAGMEQG
jgi:hypothetical protein